MHLVLTANPNRPDTALVRARISKVAEQHGFTYSLYDDDNPVVPDETDVIIVIGGDGSLIRIAHVACVRNIPMIGVHAGRVGFLTELTEKDVPAALERLKTGDYKVSTRSMLDVRINGGKSYQCLNDILVYKDSFSGVVQMDFSIDEYHAGNMFCDGLIVATPTGATGYSLSAGGPIVADGLEAMLITPICPHTLHIRPIISAMESVVSIRLAEDGFAAADGDRIAKLKKGDIVTVTRSVYSTTILTFGERNPFRLIREKLS